MQYHLNLIECGLGIIAILAKLSVEKRVEKGLYFCRTENNWPLFHGELLRYLQSKGDGLTVMLLSRARLNDWRENGDWIGWD
jgi:hypothetical protein